MRNILKVVILIATLVPVSSLRWSKRKEECVVDSSFKLNSLENVSGIMGCLLYCEKTLDCQSVSWYGSNNTCNLFDMNVLDDKRVQYSKWIASPGWKTYSMVLYPVVRIMGADPSRVMMTFEEAVITCEDQGHRIATPEDLLAARALGMDACACAWLSNGRNGLITPNVDSCPEWGYSTDVIYCDISHAVAWCRLNFAFLNKTKQNISGYEMNHLT